MHLDTQLPHILLDVQNRKQDMTEGKDGVPFEAWSSGKS